MDDPEPLHQIVLVNTEGMAFEIAFETVEGEEHPQTIEMVVEAPADNPQTIETAVKTSVDDPQDLGGLQDQLNMFKMVQQSVETVRKMKREAEAFQDWLDGQREAEELPMAKINPKRLNLLLGSYLLNKRKRNGEEYEPSRLAGTSSSIRRFLEQSAYSVPLMGTDDFKMAREVNILASKKKDLKAKGKGNRPNKVSIFILFKLKENFLLLIKLCFENLYQPVPHPLSHLSVICELNAVYATPPNY